MKYKTFSEASDNFIMWLSALDNFADGKIKEAKHVLDKNNPKPEHAPSRESAAEHVLDDISERIEDVMSSFDSMLETIGMPKKFERFFE